MAGCGSARCASFGPGCGRTQVVNDEENSGDNRPHECIRCSRGRMTVRIRHKKNKQSHAYAGFHRVICDQPFAQGGEDSGMTPPELMLSALGCCAMHYAAEYLRVRGLETENVEIRVSAEK